MKDQSGNAVSTNGTLMTVEMNVGKNRTALKLYHDGEKMTKDNGTLTDAADHYVYDAAHRLCHHEGQPLLSLHRCVCQRLLD